MHMSYKYECIFIFVWRLVGNRKPGDLFFTYSIAHASMVNFDGSTRLQCKYSYIGTYVL